MLSFSTLELIIIWAIPVFFAIVLHEIAHGYVACLLGDDTAKTAQRLSLNPIKHIDPVGTIAIPAVLLIFSNFVFGWAKPVPVNPARLNRPKTDMIYVALAGPLTNALLLVAWAICFKLCLQFYALNLDLMPLLLFVCAAGVIINLSLFLLNLIPILPLDGGRILNGLLPEEISKLHKKTEPFGLPIVFAIFIFGQLQQPISEIIVWVITQLEKLITLNELDLLYAIQLLMRF